MEGEYVDVYTGLPLVLETEGLWNQDEPNNYGGNEDCLAVSFSHLRMGLEDGDIRRLETDPRSVSREVREALAEVKAAWSEAARTNPDAVNIDEFLGLEHPESSHTLLTQRVEVLK